MEKSDDQPNLHDDDLMLDNLSWFVRIGQHFHSFPFNRINLINHDSDMTTNNSNQENPPSIIYDEFAIVVPNNIDYSHILTRIVFGYSFADDEKMMESPPKEYHFPKEIGYYLFTGEIFSSMVGLFETNGRGFYYDSDFKPLTSQSLTERFVSCRMNGKSTSNKVIIVGFGITPQSKRLFVTVNGILTTIQRPGFEITDLANENTKGFSFLTLDARKLSTKLPYFKLFKRKREDWMFSIQKNLSYFELKGLNTTDLNTFKGITQDTIKSLQVEYEIFATRDGCKETSQKILGGQLVIDSNNSTTLSTNAGEIFGGLICEDAFFNIVSYLDGFDVMKISHLNKFHFNLITLGSFQNLFEISLQDNTRRSMNNAWKQIILNRWTKFQ